MKGLFNFLRATIFIGPFLFCFGLTLLFGMLFSNIHDTLDIFEKAIKKAREEAE